MKKKKQKKKENWKGNPTTLLWAPTWAGRKRWHKRLKQIQKQIDEKRIISVKLTTRRRPAEQ
jgi:hypothetical protein